MPSGLIAITILVGNAAFQTGNLLGASLGLSLLTGLPQGLLVAIVGGLAGALLMTGTYKTIQKRSGRPGRPDERWSSLLVAILTAPNPWRSPYRACWFHGCPPGALLTVLALVGTTVVPYNLFLHASAVLERWPDADRNEQNIREMPAGHAVLGRTWRALLRQRW